jgi:hypothetical protein
MTFKNAHISPLCLCTNWRHWRQWFFKLLSVLPTDLSNFRFHLKISTASLNIPSLSPLRFQNCFRIPFLLAWRSASYVHREAREGEWDGVEKWICIFICIEASADLRTVRLASFLAVKQTEWLASLLADWSVWLIPLSDKLTYNHPGWRGFLPLWLSQLSCHTDRVSQFFFGWRHWLTSGCLPLWLIHPPEHSYWQGVSFILWLTSVTSCPFDPSNRVLLLSVSLLLWLTSLTE